VSRSAPTSGDAAADVEVENTPDYQERVAAHAEHLHQQLSKQEKKKKPAERLSDDRVWKLARQRARSEVRRAMAREKTREVSARAARSAGNAVRSGAHRNRKQLLPWAVMAPYALVGTAVHLTVQHGTVPAAAGMVLVLLLGTVGSLVAWRARLRGRTPERYRAKLHAGMGLGVLWAAVMPLTSSSALAGPFLGLLLATVWLSLSWFREHDHPIPQPRTNSSEEPVAAPTPDTAGDAAGDAARIRGVIQSWTDRVATPNGAVPGSSLLWVSSTGAVDQYRIQLDQTGRITRSQVTAARERIALALDVDENDLSFESAGGPASLMMRHLVTQPSFAYDGPVVLCNGTPISSRWEITPGANVDIVFGTHLDGQSYASYRFITQGSLNSAFILGGMGSGKTRTVEIIAIGLRLLGCYILWLDGQDGASSPLLNEQAHETFDFNMHDRADDRGVREFTTSIETVSKKRNADLKQRPELGGAYTYDPARPPVVGIIDEAHEAFQTQHPSERTYGAKLGAYAVQLRKQGMAFIALSQDYDKTSTFGGDSRLRTALTSSNNLIAMLQPDKSRTGMLPSACPALDTIPDTGFGYLPMQKRPDALWRTFDLGTAPQDTARRWMNHYDPGQLEFDPATTTTAPAEPDSPGTSSGTQAPAGVVRFPGMGGDSTEGAPAEPDAAALSEADQRALAIIQGESQTRSTLAAALGITPQGAGKKLATLTKRGFVVQMEDGRYMAR